MPKRVTKEIAQERVNRIGREITILEWNNTVTPCTIKCNRCGRIEEVKRGYYTYTDNGYFLWVKCEKCFGSIKKQVRVTEGEDIDKNIHIVRDVLQKYINKEVQAYDLIDDVLEKMGIGEMTSRKFDFSILDRVATYEVTEMNKYSKKGYIIREIFESVLPKTNERIRYEEEA